MKFLFFIVMLSCAVNLGLSLKELEEERGGWRMSVAWCVATVGWSILFMREVTP